MATVEMNDVQIMGDCLKGWTEAMSLLHRDMIKEFSENKWSWPNPTYREGVKIAGLMRGIVDSNTLRGQTMTAPQARLTSEIYEWVWNADYALAVHNGAHFKRGPLAGRVFPPRPWTHKPIKDLPKTYAAAVRMIRGG